MNHSDPLPTPDREQDLLQSTLRSVAWLVGIAATLLTPLVYWNTSNPLEVWVTALVAVVGWLTLWLVVSGRARHTPLLLVFSLLVAADLAVIAHGSVRTAAGFLFVAAVAGAGIFLKRRALIAAVVFSAGSLAVLTWAELRGWLPTPDFTVGLKVWLTHSFTLVVVGVIVFHSRMRTQIAYLGQQDEYERRVRTEQERDRNLDRFARIFRTSPSPMIAQSARNGLILDVNPAFERCYGYNSNQLLGRLDDFLWANPEQRDHYLKQLFAERRIDQFQVLGRRADGTLFEAVICSEMGNDPQDKLIITTVSDVSEQARMLERLSRSEERFAKAFMLSPLNMSITRLSDGTFLEVNRATGLQGLALEERKGRTSLELGTWPTAEARAAFVHKLQTEGRVHGLETQMRHKDGSLVDARLWAELIELEGEACVLTCTMNITPEKRRQAQLLTVAEGVSTETGEAFFSALSQHLASTTGADMVLIGECAPKEQISTLAIWRGGRVVSNLSFDAASSPCGAALVTQELLICEKDLASQFPNANSLIEAGFQAFLGKALRDADSSPIGVISAIWKRPTKLGPDAQALVSIFASRANAELVRLRRDREIARLNETLEQRVRERTVDLQKLNAELDSFAYSVSHDLKSPLRAIDGFTRLLSEQLDGRMSVDEKDLMRRVLASTSRMATLIADLLALARVSQGSMTLTAVDLSAMAHEILDLALEKRHGQTVQRHIEPGMVVRCDPRLARIALENLLNNALKYTRPVPQPLVTFEPVARDGDRRTWLSVRDNGVGFNMAFADKLFKPFQRLHMPSEFEGTGIGLATVRRIIERHGGQIEAESAVGAGARFVFTLEAASAPLPLAPRPGLTHPET
ncbi:MAG: PAS domain S-box protein [Hydrogenophaga sp.]|nr:PAS domain S-box protein [Hydrogenophaga sp.]